MECNSTSFDFKLQMLELILLLEDDDVEVEDDDEESEDPCRPCFEQNDDFPFFRLLLTNPGLDSLDFAGEFGNEADNSGLLTSTFVSVIEAGAVGTGSAFDGEFLPSRSVPNILLMENFLFGGV